MTREAKLAGTWSAMFLAAVVVVQQLVVGFDPLELLLKLVLALLLAYVIAWSMNRYGRSHGS